MFELNFQLLILLIQHTLEILSKIYSGHWALIWCFLPAGCTGMFFNLKTVGLKVEKLHTWQFPVAPTQCWYWCWCWYFHIGNTFWIIFFFETVSVWSVIELILPQIQKAILDQKGWLLQKNWLPHNLGAFKLQILFSLYCFLDQRADSNRKNVEKRWGPYSHSFQCALSFGDIHEAIVPHNNCS